MDTAKIILTSDGFFRSDIMQKQRNFYQDKIRRWRSRPSVPIEPPTFNGSLQNNVKIEYLFDIKMQIRKLAQAVAAEGGLRSTAQIKKGDGDHVFSDALIDLLATLEEQLLKMDLGESDVNRILALIAQTVTTAETLSEVRAELKNSGGRFF